MRAFVVLHTELEAYPNTGVFRDEEKVLFGEIAQRISSERKLGNKIYYLGDSARNLESELIFPAIRENLNLSGATFIPCRGTYEEQFLLTKDRLMKDKVNRVLIAGVSFHVCVGNFYSLLRGKDGPTDSREDFFEESRGIGWMKEKFDYVFCKRINSQILEDLTDKSFDVNVKSAK